MEGKKSHEKAKIASWKKSEETLSQSWRKKRRDDDASSKSNGKDENAWSSSSQKRRRIEDTRGRDDLSPMRRSEDTRGDASWKRSEKGSKRRRVEVIEIEILNDDLLDAVLLRLPVKSLIRFQNVSKHWRRRIKSRLLSDRYTLHQKTKEPKFLCLYEDISWYKRNIVLNTMGSECSRTCLVEEEDHIKKVEIVSESVDGLFCFYDYIDLRSQINVINPATRWSYRLPLAKIQLRHYFDNKKSEFALPGFGKDCVTGTYKLVWLHNNDDNKSSSCEVFDFRVKQWRQVIPPPHGHRITQNGLPTFANGWLYWFSQDKTELVAFDLHMEMFQVVPNPIIEASSSSSSSVYMDMGSIDDDPRLVWISEVNGNGMQHVWRLTNHNTGGALLKMDKMFSIDLVKMLSIDLANVTSNPHYSPLFELEAISKNGNKVMLSNKTHNLILFQLLNPTYGLFSYPPPPPSPCNSSLVPYFQSLVSFL